MELSLSSSSALFARRRATRAAAVAASLRGGELDAGPEEDQHRADFEAYLRLQERPLHLLSVADAQATKVVRLPGLLDDDEMAALRELAEAAALADPGCVSDRSGWSTDADRGDAPPVWTVVFLQAECRLQTLLPALTRKLYAAVRAADGAHWNVTRGVEHVSIRCAEYHTMRVGGGLADPEHYDYGSLLTLDVMLSDEASFDGGGFRTLEADGSLAPHAFARGDALLFVSHKPHCVAPVTRGVRHVLVVEFWEGECTRRAGSGRPFSLGSAIAHHPIPSLPRSPCCLHRVRRAHHTTTSTGLESRFAGRDEGVRWFGLERQGGAAEAAAATAGDSSAA
jgi:hypothetical protein